MSRTTRTLVLSLAVLALLAGPAAAHITANPNTADGPSPYFKTSFRVGHGCEGSPTTAVRVSIPEGLTSIHPQEVVNFDIEIVREELAEPVEGPHGETITDRVSEVVWRGGPLPDEHLQEFGLSMRLPEEADADVLWFPTIQECEEGETRWVEIPDSVEQWGDLDEPAPYVLLAAAAEGGVEAEPAVAEGDVEATQAPAAGTTDGGSTAALVLGALGALLGATALGLTPRRTSG